MQKANKLVRARNRVLTAIVADREDGEAAVSLNFDPKNGKDLGNALKLHGA